MLIFLGAYHGRTYIYQLEHDLNTVFFFPHVHLSLGIALHREQYCPCGLQFNRKPLVLYRLHHCCQDTVATAAAVAARSLSRSQGVRNGWECEHKTIDVCFTRSIQLLYNTLTPLWRDFDRLAPFQAPVRMPEDHQAHFKKQTKLLLLLLLLPLFCRHCWLTCQTSIKAWWHHDFLKISSSWHGFWYP